MIRTLSIAIVAASGLSAPVASAQSEPVNQLFDGSFETGGSVFGSVIPPQRWGSFDNAFLFEDGTNDAFVEPTIADNLIGTMPSVFGDPDPNQNFGIQVFANSFTSYLFTFDIADLPDFYPLGQLPGGIDTDGDGIGDMITDTDGDGLPEVEVTDALGTRMVEYSTVPVAAPSGWNQFFGVNGTQPGDTRPAASFTATDIQSGDMIRLEYRNLLNPSDLISEAGTLISATFNFRDENSFPAPVLSADENFANTAADLAAGNIGVYNDYVAEAVVPEGAVQVEFLFLYFGIFTDFIPLDADGDGQQDFVQSDFNFTGVIEEFETVGGFVTDEDPTIDTDGDGVPDAFGAFINVLSAQNPGELATIDGGAAYIDNARLLNLGPAMTNEPCNAADLAQTNGEFGNLDGADVSAFVQAFLAADLSADLDGDNAVNGSDLSTFVQLFVAGCPDA